MRAAISRFDQAENRLHVQKAILAMLLDETRSGMDETGGFGIETTHVQLRKGGIFMKSGGGVELCWKLKD